MDSVTHHFRGLPPCEIGWHSVFSLSLQGVNNYKWGFLLKFHALDRIKLLKVDYIFKDYFV